MSLRNKQSAWLNLSCISFLLCLLVSCSDNTPKGSLAILNGVLYTANQKQAYAQAVVAKDDTILFVGTDEEAKKYINEDTKIIDAKGRMILPGLHDAHIHPFGLVASANCDLESEALTLRQLSQVIQQCLSTLSLKDGDWLAVEQWNFTKGNQPDDALLNIRMALDAASSTINIFLRGNDGHHGAANSAALATAKNQMGNIVGITPETIPMFFNEYAQYIGVDAHGIPDGQLSEGARYLLGLEGNALTGDGSPEELAAKLPLINNILSNLGITSIQDAAADIKTLPILEAFANSGRQQFRYSGALFSDFENFSRPIQEGSLWQKQNSLNEVNVDAVIEEFSRIKDRQTNPEIFKTTAAKIFVDGVLEGNPYSVPPALPNAAVYRPYKQPRYSFSETGLDLAGYVDLDSSLCKTVRNSATLSKAEVKNFIDKNKFHPEQCLVSSGRLEHEESFIYTYIEKLEQAGFAVHAHAIGDRAVGVAIDAFSKSKSKTSHNLPQTISHAQQISDKDLARLETLPIYLTFTFAWAVPDYEYDITVTPFIDQLESLEDIYNPSNYAMSNHYPANSARLKGATITAGSDAPVDTRDPRPFVNLAAAITRAAEGKIYNPNERLNLEDALDAFTINSAKAMQQEKLTGSLEAGKKADIILLDRDLTSAAASLDSEAIADTQVLLTIFDGKIVQQKQTL